MACKGHRKIGGVLDSDVRTSPFCVGVLGCVPQLARAVIAFDASKLK